MKLAECIQEVKTEKPNAFGEDTLTGFINELESMVQAFLGVSPAEILVYDWKEDGNRQLLAPAPHDVMYKAYLKAKIDYANEEFYSYQNNQAQFNNDYEEWQAYAMRSGIVKTDIPQGIKNWW